MATPLSSQPPLAAGNRAASSCWPCRSCPPSGSPPSAPASAPSTRGPAGHPGAKPPAHALLRTRAVPGRGDAVRQRRGTGAVSGWGQVGDTPCRHGARDVVLSLHPPRAALLRPDTGGAPASGRGLYPEPGGFLLPHPGSAPAPGQDLRAPLPCPRPQGCPRYPPAPAVPPRGPVGTRHPRAGGSGTPTPCPSCPFLVSTDVAVGGEQPNPKAEGPRRPPTR